MQLPVGAEKSFTGVIDLVRMKAYTYEPGGNGKAKVGDIPANMAEQAQAAHERLIEQVAEGDDALMEEFFDKGTIAEEHIVSGLHNAIREDKIFPVLFASTWETWAPTKCWTSSSIICRRQPSAMP